MPPAARTPVVIRRQLVEVQTRLAFSEAERLRTVDVTLEAVEDRYDAARAGRLPQRGSHIDPTARAPPRLSRRPGPRETVVSVVVKSGTIPRLVARGIPAADLATDSLIHKPELWRVAGTRDLDGETPFVIEP